MRRFLSLFALLALALPVQAQHVTVHHGAFGTPVVHGGFGHGGFGFQRQAFFAPSVGVGYGVGVSGCGQQLQSFQSYGVQQQFMTPAPVFGVAPFAVPSAVIIERRGLLPRLFPRLF